MKIRHLTLGVAAALLFATTASAAVTVYGTRAALDAAAAGLITEDFEEAVVNDPGAVAFTGPLDNTTNNGIFAAGDIEAGFTMTTTDAVGAPASNNIYVGRNFGGVPTTVVSSNFFGENFLLVFGPTITAFGADLSGFEGVDGSWTVTVRSAGGDEGSFVLGTGGFFGMTSTVAITEIYFDKPDSGGTIDNVAFGEGGLVPEPGTWALMIAGFGLAGATLRKRRFAAA
jgi:hypothetical protein